MKIGSKREFDRLILKDWQKRWLLKVKDINNIWILNVKEWKKGSDWKKKRDEQIKYGIKRKKERNMYTGSKTEKDS